MQITRDCLLGLPCVHCNKCKNLRLLTYLPLMTWAIVGCLSLYARFLMQNLEWEWRLSCMQSFLVDSNINVSFPAIRQLSGLEKTYQAYWLTENNSFLSKHNVIELLCLLVYEIMEKGLIDTKEYIQCPMNLDDEMSGSGKGIYTYLPVQGLQAWSLVFINDFNRTLLTDKKQQ